MAWTTTVENVAHLYRVSHSDPIVFHDFNILKYEIVHLIK
jgi:hypothetical protein